MTGRRDQPAAARTAAAGRQASALLNTPRLMVNMWRGRVDLANPAPAPSSEDTGLISPANCMAGISVPIMAKNMAAIWLRVKVEASRPMPVETD
jgi:hypothetical protein